MDLGNWLRLQWDRVAAWAFVLAGAVVLLPMAGTTLVACALKWTMTPRSCRSSVSLR
jgi:hypothetical protein